MALNYNFIGHNLTSVQSGALVDTFDFSIGHPLDVPCITFVIDFPGHLHSTLILNMVISSVALPPSPNT